MIMSDYIIFMNSNKESILLNKPFFHHANQIPFTIMLSINSINLCHLLT